MRLTASQNALHFGMKCSKLRRILGLRPIPSWGSLRRSSDPLVGRSFLPLAIAASRLRRLQFPQQFPTCLYAKNSKISPCPESTFLAPTAPRFLIFNRSHYLKSLKICPVVISRLLKRYLKAKRTRGPAYSRAL